MDPDRIRPLATRQAQLVRSLLGEGVPPAGVDLHRIRVTRRQLAFKRWRMWSKAWPALSREVALEDRDALLRFLMSEPLDSSHPGLADGFRVARRLDREGRLGPAGRRELFAVQFVWRERHGSMVRRRWPRIGFSAEPDGLLIAVYAVRAWLFRLPIPRSAAQPPTPDPPEPEDRRVSPAPRSGTEYLSAV